MNTFPPLLRNLKKDKPLLMLTAWLVSATMLISACSSSSVELPAVIRLTPESAAPVTAAATSLPPTPMTAGIVTATAENRASQPAGGTIPAPAAYTWTKVASGLDRPTDIQSARDGSDRLFVLEQPGRIRIVQEGVLLPTPFLDITERVGSDAFERGLLGLAFHPRFGQTGYFYVNYTDKDGNTHIARFTSSGDMADPASEKLILFVEQPFDNHNGGGLAFDSAGMLVIGLGDGGSGGDPDGNGQSVGTLLGKLLRVDVDGGDPYAIPTDNLSPMNGVHPEIWALGLRNPWRLSFDRETGDLWIGDVGQSKWEEVNFVPEGKAGGFNFGWNKMEGTHSYKGDELAGSVPPVVEYSHTLGCSITGGHVYRGAALPEWQGVYLFGDFCSGIIWGIATPPSDGSVVELFKTGFRISTFGMDEAGEMYLAHYDGDIYKLTKK